MNNFLAPIGVSHNGAPGLRFLERSILKNAQGLSPCSSASDSYGCGMNNLLAPFGVYHNERFCFKVLELVLQNDQSRSPLSSASLYFVTHSSTPCAKLANSLEATFLSRYSIVSGVKVTVKEIFFTLFIQGRFLWKLINNHKYHSFSTRKIRVGGPRNENISSVSGRSVRTEEGILRTRLVPGPLLVYGKADDAGPNDSGGRGHRHPGKDLAAGPRCLEGHDGTDQRDHGPCSEVTS